MEKNLRLEIKITRESRDYVFSMPYGSLYGEAYDVAHEILGDIVKMAQEATKQVERKKEGE